MQQKERKSEQHRQLKEYGSWLAAELKKENVSLSVTGANALHVKGEITPAQRELIRVWKRQLIETLSPKCQNCKFAMNLIENGATWFCRMGCESRPNN